MIKNRYKVISYSGTLSFRKKETVGTLEELAEEFKYYLGGVIPRKSETMVKRLNDSQRGKEGTYTYKTFFIEEVIE